MIKRHFLKFYKEKFGVFRKFDLVIAFNKEAMELCVEHGEEIFPDTDILILDVFGQIAFNPPFHEQIEIISNLHKDLEHLLIISDNSNRGKILKDSVKEYIDSKEQLKEKAIYIDFGKQNFSDISRYEYYSRRKSAILLLSAYQDASRKQKDFFEQILFLNRELNLPIYTIYEKEDDAEVIGGYYLDIDKMVKQLSVKIILILNNMPLEKVDFTDMKFFQLFFNKDIADKYKINIQQYRNEAIIETHEKIENPIQDVIEIGKKVLIASIYLLFAVFIFVAIKNNKYKKELSRFKGIFSEIFNKSLQYIFIVDTKSGLIIDFNQSVAKSDFRDNVVKNKSKITDFFPNEIIDICEYKNSDNYLKFHEIEFTTKKLSFPTLLISFRYLDGEQDVSFIQFIDNSESKREIFKLKKMKEDAENRVHESTNLIDNFIREIRDPLNVKKGFEQLLIDQELDPQKKEEYVKIISFNSRKLLNIVEKILTFSELNNNTRILNNQEFSLNTQIRKITSEMQSEIKEKGYNIKLVNYFSLSEGKDILFNDKEYFSLVFRELLDNAIRFTPNGIIECGYTHPNEGKIIFYIKDTGVGMSTDEQREAFNKFNFQSRADKKNIKSGIGIGLATCRNLIIKMGGNIWLSSNVGEGTTVYFYLDYDMSVFNESENLLHKTDIDIIKQKDILIIDEDMGSQKFIIQTLKKYNIPAKAMPNYQFYNKYSEFNDDFDLIFFEYNSGFDEFFTQNKTQLLNHKISLIIMTRTILDENVISELKGVRYTVIYKPIKVQKLIQALLESLD